jgi:hypothetical protein
MKLEKPTVEKVKKYAENFFNNPKYGTNYNAIKKLVSAFPKNDNLEEILLKATVINFLYHTQIWNIFSVAKKIYELKIDSLIDGDSPSEEIVNRIARGKRNNYSFATKYCSFHNEEFYPMFDKKVKKALKGYNRENKFGAKKTNFRNFKEYRNFILKFRKHFHLETIPLCSLDKFLWLVGEEA